MTRLGKSWRRHQPIKRYINPRFSSDGLAVLAEQSTQEGLHTLQWDLSDLSTPPKVLRTLVWPSLGALSQAAKVDEAAFREGYKESALSDDQISTALWRFVGLRSPALLMGKDHYVAYGMEERRLISEGRKAPILRCLTKEFSKGLFLQMEGICWLA